ncbi:hypothetical protein [Bacillus thuringiensis]|uniref:hypothetical protein n=1 Tax=Bacillus thuringiensis TaxID=1428 RepID=UPI00211D7402|nr:hypothetical protein [Bacillus thuringiensis]
MDCELFCFILNLFDSACGTSGDGNFNKTVEIFCEHDGVFVDFDKIVDFCCERDGVFVGSDETELFCCERGEVSVGSDETRIILL